MEGDAGQLTGGACAAPTFGYTLWTEIGRSERIMSREDLRSALKQLHEEIDRAKTGDATAFAHLNELVAELEQQLGDGARDLPGASIRERLQEHVEQFEVEHPRITGIVNDIMMTLSNLGI